MSTNNPKDPIGLFNTSHSANIGSSTNATHLAAAPKSMSILDDHVNIDIDVDINKDRVFHQAKYASTPQSHTQAHKKEEAFESWLLLDEPPNLNMYANFSQTTQTTQTIQNTHNIDNIQDIHNIQPTQIDRSDITKNTVYSLSPSSKPSNKQNFEYVKLQLGEHIYQIPRPYLNHQTTEQAKYKHVFKDLPFMICLDSFEPPQERLFQDHVLKIEVEMSAASPKDPDFLHFSNIWDTFYHQKSERKAQYFFKSLYGYQWGRLNDLIEWFGLIDAPPKPNYNHNLHNHHYSYITEPMKYDQATHSTYQRSQQAHHHLNHKDSIIVYGKTNDQILRVFACWISQNITLDFNIPNYKLPNMLELVEKMAQLVINWRTSSYD